MSDFLYDFFVLICSKILLLFFRQIDVVGTKNVDLKKPILFVVAPHANQFIDPLMVMSAYNRRISYLCAKKSYDKPFIGLAAKTVHAIPVVRPQDLTIQGEGVVTLKGDQMTVSEGKFPDLLSEKAVVTLLPSNETFQVVEVLSATKVKVREISDAPSHPMCTNCKYKVTPNVDQSEMFSSVFDKLGQGECVGIFPEGGSHDRAEFLPLKPGFAIMGIGAMAKYDGLEIDIVPVGLNYFNPDRFRSRAVIEFGEPIKISKEMVEMYKAGGSEKRRACEALIEATKKVLGAVTLTAPDYDTLMLLQMTRKLYRPPNVKLSLQQSLELSRRILQGYIKFKDTPQVVEITRKVLAYNTLLKIHGIKDHQVKTLVLGGWEAYKRLFIRVIALICIVMFSLPGFVTHYPISYVVKDWAIKKAKQAKNESKVKIEGKDVIGTWKLLYALALTPLFYLSYTLIFAVVSWLKFGCSLTEIFQYSCYLFFLVLPMLGLLAVKTYEVRTDVLKSLPPLFISCFKGKRETQLVRAMRAELVNEISQTISLLGPEAQGVSKEEFEKHRIIKDRSISQGLKKGKEIEKGALSDDDIFAWDEIGDGNAEMEFFDEIMLFSSPTGPTE